MNRLATVFILVSAVPGVTSVWVGVAKMAQSNNTSYSVLRSIMTWALGVTLVICGVGSILLAVMVDAMQLGKL